MFVCDGQGQATRQDPEGLLSSSLETTSKKGTNSFRTLDWDLV